MQKTTTAIHDEKTRCAVLARTQRRENNLALSALLYAQMLILSALSLLSVASTASYLSLLIALAPAGVLYALSSFCAKKHRNPPKLLAISFALLFFSDMALCLTALVKLVCAYVLPHHPHSLIALAAAILTGLMLQGRHPGGARRTAAYLAGFFLFALLVCLVIALPECDIGYVFPLFGYGGGQVLRGAAYMTGSLWSLGALPFFTQGEALPGLKKAHSFLMPLLAMLLLALLLFFYACLLPSPLLPGAWGFVLRLQLIMEMSPSILSWSLMLISRMLLFLTGFAVAGDMTGECLRRALPKIKAPMLLIIMLLSVPLSLLPLDTFSRYLPLRFILCLICVLIALVQRKKEAVA